MTPGEGAVLALLGEGPTHGFAIARAMAEDGEIGKIWSLRRSRVYYAIDALTRDGLARPARTVSSQAGPARTVLRITPAGRRAITAWLHDPVEHVRDARCLLLLKLLSCTAAKPTPDPSSRRSGHNFKASLSGSTPRSAKHPDSSRPS